MNTVEFRQETPEVVILIHGGGLSWWNYRQEAELLSGSYHVVLPILDGHAGSDKAFTSIEENADQIISLIDGKFGGSVFLTGGLSLGAQILLEILSKRQDICRHAIIESASVIPSRTTNALIVPTILLSYGLIQKEWFARMQFRYLRIRDDLFDDYYRDTQKNIKSQLNCFFESKYGL